MRKYYMEKRSSSALTPAERQARRRAMLWGGVAGHVEVAQEAVALLQHELDSPSLAVRLALETLTTHLEQARMLVPESLRRP